MKTSYKFVDCETGLIFDEHYGNPTLVLEFLGEFRKKEPV